MVPKVTRRLQNKLIFAFVVVLLIPTGIISFYSLQTAGSLLIQKIGAEELRSLVSQANDLEKRLIDVKEDLVFLSLAPPTRRYATIIDGPPDDADAYRDAQVALLKTFLERSTTPYLDFRIIDLSGQELLHVDKSGVIRPAAPISPVKPTLIRRLGWHRRSTSLITISTAASGVVTVPYVPILTTPCRSKPMARTSPCWSPKSA